MNCKGFRFMTVLICSLMLGGATSGCVSKARYNKVLSENQACEQRSSQAEQRLSSLHQQLVETHASIAAGDQTGQNLSDEQLIAQIRQKLSEQQVAQQDMTGENAPLLSIMAKQLFPSGSASLSPAGRDVLAKVATWLKRSDARHIFIEGYTDTVPIGTHLKKTFDSNWELSTARATAVLRFLVDQGLPEDHLAAVGYGEHNQIDNSQEMSRRVEVKLHDVVFKQVVASLPTDIPQAALIDINRASAVELIALPGVTPDVARGIVEYRARAGRISSFEDLQQVRGFDPQEMAALQTMVTYGGSDSYRSTSPQNSSYGTSRDSSTINRDTQDLKQEGREFKQEVKEEGREFKQEVKEEGQELKQDIKEEGRDLKHDLQDTDHDVQPAPDSGY